jgi:hypothetical protein
LTGESPAPTETEDIRSKAEVFGMRIKVKFFHFDFSFLSYILSSHILSSSILTVPSADPDGSTI